MNQTNEYTPINTKTDVETLIIDDTSLTQPSSPSKPTHTSSITITSDNFISGIPPFISSPSYHTQISRIHSLLLSHPDLHLQSLTYKLIPSSYLGQLMTLHHELSPITYDQNYFKKYFLKSSYTAFGAFITINKEEFLIGFILYEIVSKKKFTINVQHIIHKKTCYSFIKSHLTKTTEDKFGYISQLGIINEYRLHGIGKELINKCINDFKTKNVIAVFTHVIEHNCTAIKFFEKIGWNYGGVVFSYFNFNHYFYNGQVYYNILSNEMDFTKVEIRGYNEPPIDKDWYIVKVCKKIGKFIST